MEIGNRFLYMFIKWFVTMQWRKIASMNNKDITTIISTKLITFLSHVYIITNYKS